MKRFISCIMVVLMIISILPMSVFAEELNQPKLSIDSTQASPGEVFDISLTLENNPGIVSANIKVDFDEGLTLVGATNGDVFSTLTYIPPKQLSTTGRITSSCQIAWSGFDIADEDIKDGTILTLSFEMAEDAEIGDTFNITISNNAGDVIDKNLNQFSLAAEIVVTAVDYTPCDVNDDGSINMLDVVLLSRYIVDGCKYDPDGYAVSINEKAGDFNGDTSLNMLDVVLTSRYIVDGCKYVPAPDGYGVKPVAPDKTCVHNLLATEAKDATCTEEGNIEYWQCTKCNKYFADENGVSQVSASDIKLDKKSHSAVVVPGYPATPDREGLTDGEKCYVCGELLKEQEIIPISEYAIVYNIAGNDRYLADLLYSGSVNNPNPASYSAEQGLKLKNISVAGYTFEGWYDAPGASGELIKEIPVGTTGEIELYAKWTLVTYEVIFDSPDVPVENVSFTVNKSVPLKNLELQGYTFVGWSIKDVVINPKDGSVFSDNGKIITEIPVGTANDVVVHANWTSNRNLMRPVDKLDDPLFVEDMDNNQLIFVYKIGTVENVPLYTVADLPNSAGLIWEIESDVTKSIDTKTAQTISNTISKATAITSEWTLSEDWNKVVTATEETGSENAKTQGQIDETGTVSGQQWYVSNSKGGAFSSTSSAGGSTSSTNKITDNASWGLETAKTEEISKTKEKTHQTELNASLTESEKKTFDWKLGGNIGGSSEGSLGANAGIDDGLGSAGVSAGVKSGKSWGINGSVGGSKEKSQSATISGGVIDTQSESVAHARSLGVTATINGTHGTEFNESSENHYDTSATASSNWNTTSGYETSETISENHTVSQSISELVYNKYGISASDSIGGSDVKTESTGRTSGTEDQYSSTVEYSTSEIKTLKQTLTNNGSGYGYYRVVQAATAHVFAVVGFDIATQSFYTTTHTIVDNESAKIFIDHSRKSSSFNDCENGVLAFEIPFDLYKYTTRVMMRSEGLKINYETGLVERYEGPGGNVVIPEYAADYNETTKKYSITKVTGIASSAFANNGDITGVILPDYIEEIPEAAFANCSNLETLVSYGVTKIGNDAFKNCTSLKHYSIDNFVTEIGDNAFDNVNSIDVVAANKDVVKAAINSGAKSISIDITNVEESLDNEKIIIGDIDLFRLVSDTSKEYSNLQIVSDAQKTVIGNIVFKNNKDTPVKLSSETVSFSSVSIIDAPGFAVIFTNDNVDFIIDGTNNLGSNGANVILSKDVTVSEENGGSVGKMNIKGDWLAWADEIGGTQHIAFDEDYEIKYIDQVAYEAYLTAILVSFDVNGGTLTDTIKTAYYGQLYGELPVPTREHYSFLGWFTATEGGIEITTDTPVTTLVNQTLYAHWSRNTYKVNFNANGGSVSTANKNVESGAKYGSLPTPTRTGWTFKGWFTATSGGSEITADTTVALSGEQTLYAQWSRNVYKVNFNANGGSVSTASKNVEYGNTYGSLPTPSKTGYTFKGWYTATSEGSQITSSSTVTILSEQTLYARWEANSYTYTIKYKSSNGTDLGSATATFKFGSTNTITAPAKSGYNTPATQSIKWDSTSAKTITFIYYPSSVGSTTKSGTIYNVSSSKLDYSATIEYQNRTSTSVQIRVKWTATLSGLNGYKAYNQYAQWFRASVGSASTGNVRVVTQGTWSSSAAGSRSQSATSNWITVPLSTTNKTSVNLSVYYYQANYNGTDMSYDGASNMSATWSVAIPAY